MVEEFVSTIIKYFVTIASFTNFLKRVTLTIATEHCCANKLGKYDSIHYYKTFDWYPLHSL